MFQGNKIEQEMDRIASDLGWNTGFISYCGSLENCLNLSEPQSYTYEVRIISTGEDHCEDKTRKGVSTVQRGACHRTEEPSMFSPSVTSPFRSFEKRSLLLTYAGQAESQNPRSPHALISLCVTTSCPTSK